MEKWKKRKYDGKSMNEYIDTKRENVHKQKKNNLKIKKMKCHF